MNSQILGSFHTLTNHTILEQYKRVLTRAIRYINSRNLYDRINNLKIDIIFYQETPVEPTIDEDIFYAEMNSRDPSDDVLKIDQKVENTFYRLVHNTEAAGLKPDRCDDLFTFADFLDYYGEVKGKYIWESIPYNNADMDVLETIIIPDNIKSIKRHLYELITTFIVNEELCSLYKSQLKRIEGDVYEEEEEEEEEEKVKVKEEKEEKSTILPPSKWIQQIMKLKPLISKMNNSKTYEAGAECLRELFEYAISDPACLEFFNEHDSLKTTIQDKLYEFFHVNGLREAAKWYRKLYSQRIPMYDEDKCKAIQAIIDSR